MTTALTVDQAQEGLSVTSGMSEVQHPFRGGHHEFAYEPDARVLTLNLGGHEYRVDGPALESAIRQIPGGGEKAIAEKWPLQELVLPALNWWYDNKDGDFKIFAMGDDIVSFAKPKALLFDPSRILDDMVDALGEHGGKDEIVVSDFTHTIDHTQFNVHVPEGWAHSFVDARPGDRTLGGLSFSGSLLGRKRLELAIYTHRVLCSNGMVSPDGTSRFSLGHQEGEDSDGSITRLYDWVSDTISELFSGGEPGDGTPMGTEFDRLTHLTQHAVDDHSADVLNDLFSRLRIPQGSRSEILEALAEEADGTAYGLVQAMTRAATHSDTMEMHTREALRRGAGQAARILQETCDSCRRAL